MVMEFRLVEELVRLGGDFARGTSGSSQDLW